jgi:glycosyltransferase involved in cell wall biosynthesis
VRLGIVPYLDPLGGGTYQHSLNVLAALAERRDAGREEWIVLYREATARRPLRAAGWDARPLDPRRQLREAVATSLGAWPRRLWRALRGERLPVAPPVGSVRDDARSRARMHAAGIELMLFPTADPLSFEAGVPYVTTVHDLQFRLQPQWPEFAGVGPHWDYLLRNGARWATLLLVDSEVGREDVLALYGDAIDADRVRVLPYLPAAYLPREVEPETVAAVRARYRLPDRYFFYPAQFWPHKNHLRIVRALSALADEGLNPAMVLTGTHQGAVREENYRQVVGDAERLGVASRIRWLGFVPDGHMAALYAGAAALVMPTFFGPTNIPVLEAWSFGCPVLTSGIRGIREQAGDAALLVDPTSVESIADGMRRLWLDAALAARLAAAGRARLLSYTPADFRSRLDAVVDEAKARARDGRAPRRA